MSRGTLITPSLPLVLFGDTVSYPLPHPESVTYYLNGPDVLHYYRHHVEMFVYESYQINQGFLTIWKPLTYIPLLGLKSFSNFKMSKCIH
jgi:hypothetical protein